MLLLGRTASNTTALCRQLHVGPVYSARCSCAECTALLAAGWLLVAVVLLLFMLLLILILL